MSAKKPVDNSPCSCYDLQKIIMFSLKNNVIIYFKYCFYQLYIYLEKDHDTNHTKGYFLRRNRARTVPRTHLAGPGRFLCDQSRPVHGRPRSFPEGTEGLPPGRRRPDRGRAAHRMRTKPVGTGRAFPGKRDTYRSCRRLSQKRIFRQFTVIVLAGGEACGPLHPRGYRRRRRFRPGILPLSGGDAQGRRGRRLAVGPGLPEAF